MMLQGDLKTVGEKRNQDVRVGAMFELVINRTDAQFTLERSKYRFNLCQQDLASPKHSRIFRRQVGAK